MLKGQMNILLGAFLTAALATPALAASAMPSDTVGATQDCVRLRDIDDSPAIDSKTILIKMKTKGQYKRVDLNGTCSGLIFNGFSHTTRSDEFCRTDALRVNDGSGQTCTVNKIVTIDEAEAKALQAKR